MTISPIHHASLTVTDLDRSVAFYRDMLGLRLTLESPMDARTCEGYLRLPAGTTGRMAMLQTGPHAVGALELLEFTPAPARRRDPARPGDRGLWMIAFEVVDETLAAAKDRLAARGVEFWSDTTIAELAGYPPFPMVLFEDPDGTILELLELPSLDDVRAVRAVHAGGDR